MGNYTDTWCAAFSSSTKQLTMTRKLTKRACGHKEFGKAVSQNHEAEGNNPPFG